MHPAVFYGFRYNKRLQLGGGAPCKRRFGEYRGKDQWGISCPPDRKRATLVSGIPRRGDGRLTFKVY